MSFLVDQFNVTVYGSTAVMKRLVCSVMRLSVGRKTDQDNVLYNVKKEKWVRNVFRSF